MNQAAGTGPVKLLPDRSTSDALSSTAANGPPGSVPVRKLPAREKVPKRALVLPQLAGSDPVRKLYDRSKVAPPAYWVA